MQTHPFPGSGRTLSSSTTGASSLWSYQSVSSSSASTDRAEMAARRLAALNRTEGSSQGINPSFHQYVAGVASAPTIPSSSTSSSSSSALATLLVRIFYNSILIILFKFLYLFLFHRVWDLIKLKQIKHFKELMEILMLQFKYYRINNKKSITFNVNIFCGVKFDP